MRGSNRIRVRTRRSRSPWPETTINGKTIENRWAIQPMEGWDATTTGAPTEEVRRRWQRFGESGASVIYGGEAMAVRPDGRANPNQLIINEDNKGGIAELREGLIRARKDRLVIALLTGSSSAFNSRTQAGFAGRTTKSDWSRALRIVTRSGSQIRDR